MNTDTTSPPVDAGKLLQQLQAMLAAAQPAAPPTPFAAPFNGPATFTPPAGFPPQPGRFAANPAAPTGLLVPLTIPTPAGDVSAYLQLGPDAAANPQVIIAHLAAQGWPLTLSAGCPSTNAAGSKILAFGDGRAMAVGIRSEFQLQASDDYKWNTLQRSYRGVGRATASMRKGSGFAILKTAAV